MADTLICQYDQAQLWGIAADSVQWIPSDNLDDANVNTPIAEPDQATQFTYQIWDENGCTNDTSMVVNIHEELVLDHAEDTVIYLGESTEIYAHSDQENCVFEWVPPTYITCIDCEIPVVSPLETTTYTVHVTDSLNCHMVTEDVVVTVIEEYAIDVPSAFTPGSGNDNQFVMVKGLGIKELVEFSIYNRWGERVFFTEDIHDKGWDGYYKGKLQNVDTYVYTATVKYFNGDEKQKKGTINLMR